MGTLVAVTGIATRARLVRRGWSSRAISGAVATGTLMRIRQGYYARPDAPADLVRAVRIGGVATGFTALKHYGVWAPPDERLFVLVPSNAGRLRGVEPDVVVHWDMPLGLGPPPPERFHPLAPLRQALVHALADVPAEFAVAIGDSALFTRCIDAVGLDRVVDALPRRVRRAIAGRFGGRSESGIESIVRFLLNEAGIRAEIQVRIDAVGRVDLLLDGWLIIEIDGGSHADLATIRRDRLRDALAVQRGYRTLRFSYEDVMHRWPHLLRTVRIVLDEGLGRTPLPVP